MTVKEIIAVCAAGLSGSVQCPMDCRKCFYGGEIAIQWSFKGQGYVQYYPNRESVKMDFEAVKAQWLRQGGDFQRAKMQELKAWLDKEN